MASLQALDAKKNHLFSRMQILYDLTLKISDTEIQKQFIEKARFCKEIHDEFSITFDNFIEANIKEDEKYVISYANLSAFEDMYDKVKSMFFYLEERRLQQVQKKSEPKSPAVISTESRPKIPPISVPNFNGNPADWPVFYQLFKSLIHENNTLSKLEKMHYLVSSLQGSAKTICTGVVPVQENYDALFKSLIDRYEDKRILAATYLDKILSMKPIIQESEKDLKTFLDNFVESITALKQCKITDLVDYIFLHIALKKLDSNTVKLFEMSCRSKEIPTFDELVKFVREQAKILGRTQSHTNVTSKQSFSGKLKNSHSFIVQNRLNDDNSLKSNKCLLCSQLIHPLYLCNAFVQLSINERWNIVKEKNACFNCLSLNSHTANNCMSKITCKKCNRNHHTLLHLDNKLPLKQLKTEKAMSDNSNASQTRNKNPQHNVIDCSNKEISTSLTHHSASRNAYSPKSAHQNITTQTVLLATAKVLVEDASGKVHSLRALLDPGSQSHFITNNRCAELGFPVENTDWKIKGIGASSLNANHVTTFTFKSKLPPNLSYKIDALVVETLTDKLPLEKIDVNALSYIKSLSLADEEFHEPSNIDLLLGAQVWPLIIGKRKVFGPPSSPVAMESSLGYLLMGTAPTESVSRQCSNFCSYVEKGLGETMEKFWKLEEVPSNTQMTEEEQECEKLFCDTYKRQDDGRFCVSLPFKSSPSLLGSSKENCTAKFQSQEKRLLKNPFIYTQYNEVLKDHLSKGYIKPLTVISADDNDNYYIPHHGVHRPDHPTTPLRVVYNASAVTSSGWSLNDLLHVGPKLQSEIFDVLLNFRLFQYILSADVKKMYLQILINPEHRKYQRILWRFSQKEEIETYEMNTVIFGIKSSPYLAQRVIKELCNLEKIKYPHAAQVAVRDIYVDDIITSTDTEQHAMKLFDELTQLFKAGGFTLTKWSTNVKDVKSKLLETNSEELKFDDADRKILGMSWSPSRDTFQFEAAEPESGYTKRIILSKIARVFDPLGLLAPIITTAKLIMKAIWISNVDWDEIPNEIILEKWKKFESELKIFTQLHIPRHSCINGANETILVGFADASEKAYGAVIYVVTQNEDQNTSQLLCAKSKVAPKKLLSIPRLELCAALLLSTLMKHILDVYQDRHSFDHIVAFSDSEVTLHWINASPGKWKTFVANRVNRIQENLSKECWKKVSGTENPADCLSRGLMPSELVNNKLWFQGPNWLITQQYSEWPLQSIELIQIHEPSELRTSTTVMITTTNETVWDKLLQNYSSLRKILTVTAYILRVFKRRKPKSILIQASELEEAEGRWIHHIQQTNFQDILLALKESKKLPRLTALDIFLHDSILRVGGRLENSNLSFEECHPILLPKDGKFVQLLIEDYHVRNAHAGAYFTHHLIRNKFWILSARKIIRSCISKCNLCFKTNPKVCTPKMAPLPKPRIQEAKAFLRTGVDYAGPFTITMSRRRGSRTQKAYICLFICLSVKAVHLELVSDLSTAAFLDAFKRFLSRRGPCEFMQSDCGTNFVGASKELKELYNLMRNDNHNDAIGKYLAYQRIEWKFNPPSAPHFGGIWEANVKSVKTHLRKIIGLQVLSYEEFNTLLTQVEAILNSRPLCVLDTDVNTPNALTPAHFLTLGSTLNHLPATDVTHLPMNRLNRHQLIDHIVQGYWKRWKEEYLQTLQQRSRWTASTSSVKKGSVVIVMKENTPPLAWPLGIVEEVFPGKDGVIRVASVRTQYGLVLRPVVKLCPLPTQ